MKKLNQAFYGMAFDVAFMSKTANDFQDFFSDIMAARYPGDFIATRTWGRNGDQKCDGYILSLGFFYQVYAPDELSEKNAVKKMDEDFTGALQKWEDGIKSWIFVHNAKKGNPPHIVQKLTSFQKNNPSIVFGVMGSAELKKLLFETEDEAIRRILGPIPTYQDVNNLSMEAIKTTLLGFVKNTATTDTNMGIVPVSAKKLDANGLSADTKALFQIGMAKSGLLSDFFRKWHNPVLEDQVANEINKLYKTARNEELDSDCVFYKIYETIIESGSQGPTEMISALAIMAYFFQTCDIFEQPREEDGV